MNRRLTAIRDTISRVREGSNPYDGGPFDSLEMMKVADTFADQVQHDPFVEGIKAAVRRGEDPSEHIRGYLSVVFAQGFSAGSRYETLEGLGDRV